MEEVYTGWFEVANLRAAPHSTIRFFVSTTSGVVSEFSMIDALTLDASGVGAFRQRFSYHEIHFIVVEGLSAPPSLGAHPPSPRAEDSAFSIGATGRPTSNEAQHLDWRGCRAILRFLCDARYINE